MTTSQQLYNVTTNSQRAENQCRSSQVGSFLGLLMKMQSNHHLRKGRSSPRKRKRLLKRRILVRIILWTSVMCRHRNKRCSRKKRRKSL
jgi:hypothetical protein